jgi:hypothetical protein
MKEIIFTNTVEKTFRKYYEKINEIKNQNINRYNKYSLHDSIYHDINNKILLYMTENVEIADDIIKKELDKRFIIDNFSWKLCLTKEDFLFNNPFTLDDIIFIPLGYINKNIKNRKELIKTLIHEYIHISQRLKTDILNNYINENKKNWKMLDYKIDDNLINDNYILNPDTYEYNKSFLYNKDDKLYYGRFEYHNGLEICWYEYIDNKFIRTNKNIHKYEHPYEEMAYVLSNNLDKYF